MSWLVLQESVDTQTLGSSTARVIQQYSHHKLYPATTLCSHRSIFSSFRYIFVWPCEFSTKSRKFTCSWCSLEFATSMPWTYRAKLCSNASHGRSPHLHSIDLCQNSLSYEKIQWLKQTSSSGTQSSCTAPTTRFSVQFPWPDLQPFDPMHRKTWKFGFPGSLRETLTDPGGSTGEAAPRGSSRYQLLLVLKILQGDIHCPHQKFSCSECSFYRAPSLGNKVLTIFICFSNSSSRPPPPTPPVLPAWTRGTMGVLPQLQESPEDQSCPQEHTEHTEHPAAPRPRRAGDTRGGRRHRQHLRSPAHPRAPFCLLPLEFMQSHDQLPVFPFTKEGAGAPSAGIRRSRTSSPGWDIPSLRAAPLCAEQAQNPPRRGGSARPAALGTRAGGAEEARRGAAAVRPPARCRRSVRPAPPHARSRPGRAWGERRGGPGAGPALSHRRGRPAASFVVRRGKIRGAGDGWGEIPRETGEKRGLRGGLGRAPRAQRRPEPAGTTRVGQPRVALKLLPGLWVRWAAPLTCGSHLALHGRESPSCACL